MNRQGWRHGYEATTTVWRQGDATKYTTWDDILRVVGRRTRFRSSITPGSSITYAGGYGPRVLSGRLDAPRRAGRPERAIASDRWYGNTYRHPAVLANMAATVDQISHGRTDFGIGAGWNEMEQPSTASTLRGAAERLTAARGLRGHPPAVRTEPVATSRALTTSSTTRAASQSRCSSHIRHSSWRQR